MNGAPVLAITGGTGFVGQAVLARALAAGLRPRALTRRAEAPGGSAQPEWVAGTLADRPSLDRLCAGADAVIHIAGAVNLPTRAALAAVNQAGTQTVLDAARAAGVRRFIHVSSLAARAPELSDYGWSKRMAEEAVIASGLDWTIIRPPAIYGPHDRELFEMFRAARLRVMPLPPAGRASMIHVDDLARLLLGSVCAQGTATQIYEPDDGQPRGWAHADMARMIGAAMGRRVWPLAMPRGLLFAAARLDRMLRGAAAKLTPDRASYMCHPDWVSDPARCVPPAVWQPQIATAPGLAATAQWYRQVGWL